LVSTATAVLSDRTARYCRVEQWTGLINMQIERFNIDGIVAIVPVKRGDSRGFFSETYRKDVLAAAGITSELVQDNHVYSADRGVLRGLHFQTPRTRRASWCVVPGDPFWMSALISARDRPLTVTMLRSSCQRTIGSRCGFPPVLRTAMSRWSPVAFRTRAGVSFRLGEPLGMRVAVTGGARLYRFGGMPSLCPKPRP
jgi:hypothetical protein